MTFPCPICGDEYEMIDGDLRNLIVSQNRHFAAKGCNQVLVFEGPAPLEEEPLAAEEPEAPVEEASPSSEQGESDGP